MRVCASTRVYLRERHAQCTLTTSQCVCRGVMDAAVAHPLKSNLHAFGLDLIGGREGRFHSGSRTISYCKQKSIQGVFNSFQSVVMVEMSDPNV